MKENTFTGYANSFQTVAKLGLENIRILLSQLGNPQDKLCFIHVAGTNGKGSVCAFLQAMFTHAGYRTGKFISPNLIRVNERISIDGKEISDAELNRLLGEVEAACKKAEAESGVHPTQFEIWTAAAFCYFAKASCDYVVLEVGLGGALDATNSIQNTAAAVITHIALDHTEYLGNTLREVARAKAGIIKPNCKVFSVAQDKEVFAVLLETCAAKSCSLTLSETPVPRRHTDIYEAYEGTLLSLGGINQLENAALSVTCARAFGIGEDSIRYGLSNAKHPARFEKCGETLYYDGAHNPDGVQALLNNLKRYFPNQKFTFIMATMADKDITASLNLLSDCCAALFTVTVKDNPRAMAAGAFAELACSLGLPAKACPTIGDACRAAKKLGWITVICGSLYLYKDFDTYRNEGDV